MIALEQHQATCCAYGVSDREGFYWRVAQATEWNQMHVFLQFPVDFSLPVISYVQWDLRHALPLQRTEQQKPEMALD